MPRAIDESWAAVVQSVVFLLVFAAPFGAAIWAFLHAQNGGIVALAIGMTVLTMMWLACGCNLLSAWRRTRCANECLLCLCSEREPPAAHYHHAVHPDHHPPHSHISMATNV